MEIIPAIMPKSYSDIDEHVSKVFKHVEYVQLDIMDGNFVEEKTWPFFDKNKQSARELMEGEIKLPYFDKVKYEFDLMVKSPEIDLKKYIKLGANRLIVHVNSIDDMDLFLKEVKDLDVEWGIAFLTTDKISDFKDLILKAHFVQLMGIENIGYQGQGFDPRVLDQIIKVRDIKPDCIISIDGAVNLETAYDLTSAGASRLVSGSTVFGVNAPEVAIEDLKKLSNG